MVFLSNLVLAISFSVRRVYQLNACIHGRGMDWMDGRGERKIGKGKEKKKRVHTNRGSWGARKPGGGGGYSTLITVVCRETTCKSETAYG